MGQESRRRTSGGCLHLPLDPRAKAADSRRRNALRASGYTVVEADWVVATGAAQGLRADVLAALACWDAEHAA